MKNTIFESKDKNNDSRTFICNNFYYFNTIQSLKIENSEVDCSGSFIETSAIFSGSNQNYIITFNKVIFENLSSIISTIKMPEPVILDNNIAEDKRFTLSLKVNDSSFITDDLDIIFFFKEDDGFENYLYSIIDIDLTNNTFIIDNKFSINSLSTIFEHNTLRAKEISTCLFGNFANNIIISDTRSDELVEHLGEQSDSIENFNSHYIGETVKLLDKETRGSLFWRILDLFQDSGIIAPVNNEKQYLAEKYLALIFKKNEINAIKIIIESNGANIDKDKLEEFSKQSKASLFEDIKSSFDQVEEGQLKESLKSINENIQVLKVDNFYLIDQLDIEKVLEDKAFEFDLIVNKNIKHYEPTEDSLANGFEVFSDITEDAIGRSRFPKSTLGSIQGEDIGKVKIFFTAGSNGSLSGKTSFRLNKGSKWTMIDVPKPIANNGYRFSSWSPNLKDDSYIINDDLEFKAKFERKPSSGGSGGGSGGSDKEPDKEPDKEIEKPKDRNGRELGTIIEEKVDIQLNKKDHFAYVKGYGDGSVRPTRDITREEVAIIIYRLIVEKDKEYITTSEHSFSDIESNRWSEKAIASLARVGIIKGYEDGTFKPTKSISRSEAAKIIGRFTDTIVCETNFPDILDHWAEDYINSVEAKGWIKGYNDGTFKPNNNITRGEYVTLMNNLLERKVKIENTLPGIKEFNDLNTNKWYYEQMIEALNGHEYEKLEDNTGKWIKLIDKYFE